MKFHTKVIKRLIDSLEAIPYFLIEMLEKLYVGAGGQFKVLKFDHDSEGVFFKVIVVVVELCFIHFGE